MLPASNPAVQVRISEPASVTSDGAVLLFVAAEPTGENLGLADDALGQAFCAPTDDGFQARLASGIQFVVAGLDPASAAAVVEALWGRRPVELFGLGDGQEAQWAVECGLAPHLAAAADPQSGVPVQFG